MKQREIKFRAWDKENKKMLQWANHYVSHFGSYFIESGIGKDFRISTSYDFILMQFTGLKDNKRTKEYQDGQEIFEGDVVCYEDENFYIEFSDATFWCIFITKSNEKKTYNLGGFSEEVEIIGNIYSNPELLK